MMHIKPRILNSKIFNHQLPAQLEDNYFNKNESYGQLQRNRMKGTEWEREAGEQSLAQLLSESR